MLDIIRSKHRSLALLTGVLVVQVLMLAVQIKRAGDVRLIRVWAVTLVTPFQKAGTWVIDKVSGSWGNYVDLRDTRAENERLRGELAQLRLRSSQLESRAAEADRLTSLLAFRDAHTEAPMLAARVIGANATGANRTITINRGEKDGVRKNMGVITPEGVVGKTLEVYSDTTLVQLITDKDSGVGAVLGATRTQGVVRGTDHGDMEPTMINVVNEEKVADGEQILTSGLDKIFPKDLPLGSVAETSKGEVFKVIRVRPAARLDRLEEVLVLLTRQELEMKEAPATTTGTSAAPAKTAPPKTKPEEKPVTPPEKKTTQ